MRIRHTGQSRNGFTLVELLVSIAVIGILLGMLSAAVIPALNSANRTAILTEMKQIELSIESFKNQYGFYPPSWVKIQAEAAANGDVAAATLLLQYINRISPNNQEGGTPGSRPIDAWWLAIGQNINHAEGQDLVFWLSGLSKNKQFPLTHDGASLPNAYGVGVTFDGVTFERDVFYEFKVAQLEISDDGVAATYMQQSNAIAPFLYIDAKSYGIDPTPNGYDGYHVRNEVDTDSTKWFNSYENRKTFQLICWGLDKEPFDPDNPPTFKTRWAHQDLGGLTILLGADKYAGDNLCNFCDGMLERYLNKTLESSAVQ